MGITSETSVLLKTYVELKKTLRNLDKLESEKYAEMVREIMDVLWWELSKEERELLDAEVY